MPIHDETRLRALRFTGRANHLSISQRTADSFRSITCGRRTVLMTMTSSVESHSLWKVGRMRFHLPFHFTEKGRQSSSGPGTTDPGPTIIPATCLACEVRGGWGGGGDLSLFAFAPSRLCVCSRDRSRAAHRASDRLRPATRKVSYSTTPHSPAWFLVNLPSPPLEVFSMAKPIPAETGRDPSKHTSQTFNSVEQDG